METEQEKPEETIAPSVAKSKLVTPPHAGVSGPDHAIRLLPRVIELDSIDAILVDQAEHDRLIRRNLWKKRCFDLVLTSLGAIVWLPVIIITSVCMRVLNGKPVFYRSLRRIHRDRSIVLYKFRTMVRDAEKILNRNTIPISEQRFLNIPADSPVYTPFGRLVERVNFTEIPQFFHVLLGQMTLVGNRPLPENVIDAIREKHPLVEYRFHSPCGMTGPVQLIGRDALDDADRLTLEIEYCWLSLTSYSFRLDFALLLQTILIASKLTRPKSAQEVMALMRRLAHPKCINRLT